MNQKISRILFYLLPNQVLRWIDLIDYKNNHFFYYIVRIIFNKKLNLIFFLKHKY